MIANSPQETKALQEDILEKVADSDPASLLVSAASLASKNCNRELIEALNQKIKIISIILEHCDWQRHQLAVLKYYLIKASLLPNGMIRAKVGKCGGWHLESC